MQQETVRNRRREKSKILRKVPVTPKIINTKPKSKLILSSMRSSVLLNEDIFLEDIERTVRLTNKSIQNN
jgi:hypothetical protein